MSDNFILEIADGIVIQKIKLLRVTINELQEFKDILNFIEKNGYNKIIIDFSECHYLDSSVIGLMITFVKDLRQTDGDLKLVMPEHGNILNVFAQTSLNKIFKQFPTLELALASYN